jgi:hypothetical protein
MVAVPTADGLIDTWNAPVELNAGTVTVAGTVAMEVLLLASETVAPPDGVLAVNVNVAEGTVFVRGPLPEGVDEQAVRDVIAKVPGVTDVDLQLTTTTSG